MKRIAIAALEQETNTFSPVPTEFADFDERSITGKLLTGEEILETRNINLQASGFLNTSDQFGWTSIPLISAISEPGGTVRREAYEQICERLLVELENQTDLDGIYLGLHGAMVVEGIDDPELDVLRRVRASVPGGLPVIASIDLHGNISPDFAKEIDGLVGFRTFPHVDVAETGRRAALLMAQRLDRGAPFKSAFREISFLIPPHMQGTLDGPMREIYELVALLEATTPGVAALNFACGFNAADVYFAGPSIFAYGDDEEVLRDTVDRIASELEQRRPRFASLITKGNEAAKSALKHSGAEPLILADVQDNPGGGSAGDCVEIIKSLRETGVRDVAVGVIFDPAAADAATARGEGQSLALELGGKLNLQGSPLEAEFRVKTVIDKPFKMVGPMAGGLDIDMGPSVVLELDGIEIIVVSNRVQCLDRGFFLSAGIDPAKKQVLVLKSTLHYRSDFDRISANRINVESLGSYLMDPRQFDYQKLRTTVDKWPVAVASN